MLCWRIQNHKTIFRHAFILYVQYKTQRLTMSCTFRVVKQEQDILIKGCQSYCIYRLNDFLPLTSESKLPSCRILHSLKGMMYMLFNSNIHSLMATFLLFILPQKAPPSRRNPRGPKRCSCTWTSWPFHLQS